MEILLGTGVILTGAVLVWLVLSLKISRVGIIAGVIFLVELILMEVMENLPSKNLFRWNYNVQSDAASEEISAVGGDKICVRIQPERLYFDRDSEGGTLRTKIYCRPEEKEALETYIRDKIKKSL